MANLETTTVESYVAPKVRKRIALSLEDIKTILDNPDVSLFGALRMGLSPSDIGKKGTLEVDETTFMKIESYDSKKDKDLTHVSVQTELRFLDGDKKPYNLKVQSPKELTLLSTHKELHFQIGKWDMTTPKGELIPKLMIQSQPFVVDANQDALEGKE